MIGGAAAKNSRQTVSVLAFISFLSYHLPLSIVDVFASFRFPSHLSSLQFAIFSLIPLRILPAPSLLLPPTFRL